MTLTGESLREEARRVARLKRGEEDAFEDVVRGHSGRLIGLARSILGDEDLARDAVQEAFLNAFRALDGALGPALLRTGGLPLHLAGKLRRDAWAGGQAVQFIIEDAARVGG